MRYRREIHGSRFAWLWHEWVVMPFIRWRRIGRGTFWITLGQAPCHWCCRRIEPALAQKGETACASCGAMFEIRNPYA